MFSQFHIGKEKTKEFDFLGRRVTQKDDYSIPIDQHQYVKNLERVFIPKERRQKPQSPLTPKELSDYRSIVGQLAWPARESMPQLAYTVSDLQQKTAQATVHDLAHANNALSLAKRWAKEDKQCLRFLPFKGDCHLNCVIKTKPPQSREDKKKERATKIRLGLGAVHDVSFM